MAMRLIFGLSKDGFVKNERSESFIMKLQEKKRMTVNAVSHLDEDLSQLQSGKIDDSTHPVMMQILEKKRTNCFQDHS